MTDIVKKIFQNLIFITILTILNFQAIASPCINAFPDGVQTTSTVATEGVTFTCGAQILNNQNPVLNTRLVTNGTICNNTCGPSGFCVAQGTQVSTLSLGTFQNTTSNSNITVSTNATQTIGSAGVTNFRNLTVNSGATANFFNQGSPTANNYRFRRVTFNANSTINLQPGSYWMQRLSIGGNNVTINVVGSGRVRLFVQDATSWSNSVNINMNSVETNPAQQFFMYVFNSLTINNAASNIKGVLYSTGTMALTNLRLEGAALGQTLTVGAATDITYSSNAISDLDQVNFCGGAGQCAARYTNGLQTHGTTTSNTITFTCNGQISNAPTTSLRTRGVVNPTSCARTCTPAVCSASGTPMALLDDGTFQTQSGGSNFTVTGTQTIGTGGVFNYATITVNANGVLNFTPNNGPGGKTLYRINQITANRSNTTINFIDGDYWINTLTTTGTTGTPIRLNFVGTGTARIFINNAFSNANLFQINENGSPSNMFIYANGDLRFTSTTASTVNAFMYSGGLLELGGSTTATGGFTGRRVTLGANTTVTYDPLSLGNVDFGDLCPTAANATNFTITIPNAGLYCVPVQVTVTAKNGTDVAVDYAKTIVLDTGTGKGTWSLVSGGGSFSDPTLNDGTALYTYNAADEGVATFELVYPEGVSPINISVFEQINPSITDDNTEGTLTFSPAGFILTESEIIPPATPVAFAAPQVSADLFTVHITAYGSDDTCGITTGYTGSKDLKFWFNYVNPTTGTRPVVINGTQIGTDSGSPTAIPVIFTDGKATVSMRYRDVGQIQVYCKDDTVTIPAGGVVGSTNSFVVKPAKFNITVVDNPSAASATDPAFKKAGEPFTVVVTALNSNDAITPNYGNETIPEGIKVVSSQLVLPAGGRNGSNNDGAIINGTSFTKTNPGEFTATTLSFDEVGIIRLTASVASGSYLGAGDVSGPESGNVGRFTPGKFDVTLNTPSFNSGCLVGGFTYMDQPFFYNVTPNLLVTARSLTGNVTQNYSGAFWKLDHNTFGLAYNHGTAGVTLNSSGPAADIQFTNNNNGTANYVLGNGTSGFRFVKAPDTEHSPFEAEIEASLNITDSDNITTDVNPYKVGGTTAGQGILFLGGKNIYHGRLNLNNASGSELTSLNMSLQTEFFDGGAFVRNSSDSCTVFSNPANVTLVPNPPSLSTTVSLGTGAFVAGSGTLILSAPNPTVTGYVDVVCNISPSGANLPWLEYPYAEDTRGNPFGRASFGVFKGNERVIYKRENVN